MMTSAPPTACIARAAIRTSSEGAAAQPAVAAAKISRPLAVATAGSPRTHTRAAGTAASASTTLNAVRTHATSPTSAPKSSRISGSASVTIARVAEHHGDDQRRAPATRPVQAGEKGRSRSARRSSRHCIPLLHRSTATDTLR